MVSRHDPHVDPLDDVLDIALADFPFERVVACPDAELHARWMRSRSVNNVYEIGARCVSRPRLAHVVLPLLEWPQGPRAEDYEALRAQLYDALRDEPHDALRVIDDARRLRGRPDVDENMVAAFIMLAELVMDRKTMFLPLALCAERAGGPGYLRRVLPKLRRALPVPTWAALAVGRAPA